MICRRCRQPFAAAVDLSPPAACPHCGATVQPICLRSNANAASVALLAIVLLSWAMLLPMMTVHRPDGDQSYSLPGGIAELFRRGHAWIALILLIFSILFPYAKLMALLLATSAAARLTARARRVLHRSAELTGRYSLLDILVVAVMIVAVQVKGLVSVEVRSGTILFASAIVLSIISGLLVNIDAAATASFKPPLRSPSMTDPYQPNITFQSKRRFAWGAWLLAALLGLCVSAGGVYLLLTQPPRTDAEMVEAVRLSARPGIDLSKLEEILDTPDYYVELWSEQGKLRSATFDDTRVGNGLTFPLPFPVRLMDVREIKVFDANIRKDELVDRVDHPQRQTEGEKFRFEIIGPPPMPDRLRQVGWSLLIAGGAVVLLVVVRVVRAQAM